MTRTFLIATVAALAITAPAQAQRAEQREKAAERAKAAQAKKADRSEQRAKRAQARPRAAQRVRAERPQVRERVRAERPQPRQRAQAERRAPRVESRARAQQQRAAERRSQAVNRAQRQRVERQRAQRVERQRPQRAERLQRAERSIRVQQRPAERRAAVENRNAGRLQAQRQIQQRRQIQQQQRLQQRQVQQQRRLQQQRRVELRAERSERRQNIIERRSDRRAELAQQRAAARQARLQRPSRTLGERLELRREAARDSSAGYTTQRYSSRYDSSPQYFYYHDRDDGYLYQVRRDTRVVAASFPLLGGAFGLGQPLPVGYSSYNVPYAYRSLYYDTPNYRYRYGDGAIYRVDPTTQLIQLVVALLTGQSLGIGQMLPAGYDVYNVPYSYRSTYFDSDDMWYRYNDGYIYGVDPYSRRIESMYPVSYGGYAVGYPVPSYASYGGYTGYGAYGGYPGYSVPYGYNHLYYGQPGYNYQYANGGIYQVDPVTRLVTALVALVTGANFGIGQTLPMGYDVYNVPYAYRSSYFDTADSWYRYDDGYIYEVDPYSRMIEAAIPVSYGGYVVGQPVPSAYPGYAVPAQYGGLYNAQPGYDYRYFDGGIYQVDPTTRIVQSLVALLTGQTLGVGQMLPTGYDVYNVPYAWRDRYHDSDRHMYRYADGYIYQVDPRTRLIQAVIDAVA